MNRFLAGFLFSTALCSVALGAFLYPQVKQSYHQVGFNDGTITARWEMAEKIKKTLGTDLSATESRQVLFNVKTISVVVVERKGTKTLRVID